MAKRGKVDKELMLNNKLIASFQGTDVINWGLEKLSSVVVSVSTTNFRVKKWQHPMFMNSQGPNVKVARQCRRRCRRVVGYLLSSGVKFQGITCWCWVFKYWNVGVEKLGWFRWEPIMHSDFQLPRY